MRIIWVDDDSFGILSVLVLRLKREGFIVEKFKYFEDAAKYIDEDLKPTDSILIDFILPSKEVRFAAFLGLKLAEKAIQKKIKRITFLSVVGENEVEKELQELFPTNNGGPKYQYFNKAEIVERDEFKKLVESLRSK